MKIPSLQFPFGLFLLWVALDIKVVWCKSRFSFPRAPWRPIFARPSSLKLESGGSWGRSSISRGGSQETDDERYSRQVYTLGARAHGLVRSSTIYVDGPSSSGLVYESVKNLALSGVGKIVLWTVTSSSDESSDEYYHDSSLDDLGKAYQRGAREELNLNDADADSVSPVQVMEEYIRRLNPAVQVSREERPVTMSCSESSSSTTTTSSAKGVILCIDRPYDTQVKLNQLAREQCLAFVAMETAGVYGRVFCDFGPEFEVFDADGETPLVTPLDRVEVSPDPSDEEGTFLVRTIDTEKHDVSRGDTIEFQISSGEKMTVRCSVVKVMTPYRIKVKIQSESTGMTEPQELVRMINEEAASFTRVKIPVQLSFLSLEEVEKALKSNEGFDLFTPCDLDKSFDDVRRSSVLSYFRALSTFVEKKRCLPTMADQDTFQELLGECASEAAHNQHVENFLSCCKGKLCPLQAMFGAVGAQEALKAVSGLYNPVKQILLYDCDELLVNQDKGESSSTETKPKKPKTGLAYILGRQLEKKAKSARLFVVGAGAIGCEVLKNLAALSVATGKKGCISLTDMDTIERSNLSRQLLFRDSNIGDFKSEAAQQAILRMNPAVNTKVYTNKVGEEGHGPFNKEFWSGKVDVVMNALDNMEARLFMDQQCVANQKALIDAGTLGSKGNVQVVVPHQSESYGSSVDPPEPAIPVCTLKNFPYLIAHTIQWGRDLFDGLHQRRPRHANDIAKSLESSSPSEVAQGLLRDLGNDAAVDAAFELAEDLAFAALPSDGVESAKAHAVQWAVDLATRLFYRAIMDLLRDHPPDSLDEDGEPFWTGTRKMPTPILYSPTATTEDAPTKVAANDNLVEFVQSAARLRLEMLFGDEVDCRVTAEVAKEALLNVQPNEDSTSPTGDDDDKAALVSTIVQYLQSIPEAEKQELQAVEFEKDDEGNGHVQLVNAASNLRAICYGIPPVNAMETRRVAGRIVPAMITTTAVVSALSCIEFLKLLQKAPLPKHRNAFINLALPFFAFTMPVPAEEIPGPGGISFTLWDSIEVKEARKKTGDKKTLTLKRFLKSLKKKISEEPESLEVSTVSAGQYMIYANFLHEDDEEMMGQSIFQLVREASEEEEEFAGRSGSTEHAKSKPTPVDSEERLELSVTVEDTTTGEEFELPPVHVTRD